MNKQGLGFRPYVISIIVIVFVAFLLTGFAVNLLNTTNPSSPVLQTVGNFNLNSSYNSIGNSFDNVTAQIESSKNALGGASASPLEYLFVIVKETVSIPIDMFKAIISLLVSFSSLFIGFFLAQTGLPEVLITAINLMFSVIILTAIFLGIKFVRTGQD
jgi:hypothetical protein